MYNSEYSKSHWIIHLKWVSCMIREFSLNTAVHINKKEKLKVLASIYRHSHQWNISLYPKKSLSPTYYFPPLIGEEKYSVDGYVSPLHYFWISNILSVLNTMFFPTRLWVHRSQKCLRNLFIQKSVLHSLACIFNNFILRLRFLCPA